MSDNDQQIRSRLAAEAAQVRSHERAPVAAGSAVMSPARAFACLALIAVCVGGSVLLLLSEPLRTAAISVLAGGISGYVDAGREVFPMPRPRPSGPETVYIGGGPSFSSGGEDVIYEPDELARPDSDAEPDEFVPASRDSAMKAAWDYLIENSEIAGRLSRGEIEGYTFKEWNPRQARDPVFLVDMVVVRASDSEKVTLVFQVDMGRQRVRAVNQAARDLERGN